MKIKYFFLISLICVGLISTSCSDADLAPSYIEITESQLIDAMSIVDFNQTHETNYDAEDLAAIQSSLFRDVWITVNNDNRGVYTLPCKVPVLASDSCNVTIMPAIRLNGYSTILPAYPFAVKSTQRAFLKTGESTVINGNDLSFQYEKNITLPVLETFEAGTRFSRLESDTGATFQITTTEKGKVGHILLDEQNTFFDLVLSGLRLPGYGKFVLLEIDYQCDAEFSVSLLLKNASGYVIHDALVNVIKSNEWKKIYINLTQSISRNYVGSDGYATDVKVYLSGGVNYDENGNPIPTNFYMDNVKVLYVE